MEIVKLIVRCEEMITTYAYDDSLATVDKMHSATDQPKLMSLTIKPDR
ncbi:hypothetical protein HanXRQr2_Chr14g0659321 [Helianthus annuus]|uniref:Uncharacterized protein n=1 Tax=Helianthus annuus TaxID=4232 RepID=A0A9K3H943_HELAN|nr:hypothetical protein HanXRQr2_Chr14g0659321 [Helianthus annuus]KAJ0841608.1 hypothetical protein HanPSC8_Chr14g0632351 [Helianthus annuus]